MRAHDQILSKKISSWQYLKFNSLFVSDWFLGPNLSTKLFRNTKDSLNTKIKSRLSAKLEGSILEPLDEISPKEIDTFHEHYLKTSRPVVIRGGAKHWPAYNKWTPSFFSREYGNDEIPVSDGIGWKPSDKPGYSVNSDFSTIRFSDLIDGLDNGSSEYLRFYPILNQHPELVSDLLVDEICKLGIIKGLMKKMLHARIYIGAKGTSTAIHHAPISNLYVQIHGEKRWDLYSPVESPLMYPVATRTAYFGGKADYRDEKYTQDSLFKFARGFSVTLEEGDVLFIPRFWWHAVRNLSTTIALSFWWYKLSVLFKSIECYPQNLLCLMGSPNPLLITLGLEKGGTEDTVHVINNGSNEKAKR